MTSASRTIDEAILECLLECTDTMNRSTSFIRGMKEELKAKDRQIQELKEELEKYRRREEIHEFLIRAQDSHKWCVGYYAGVCASSRGICHRNESMLARDDLHDVLRVFLENDMDAEEERILHIQERKEKGEREYNELIKPLLDELDALK